MGHREISMGYNAFAARRGHTLQWNNITVEKGGKVIDDNISGMSAAGYLTAIMGHSGSGKTTLLRALGGRGTYSSGQVLLDGAPIDPGTLAFQRKIAYVADSEVLEPTSTCLEAIRFSARLRLPASFSDESIDRISRSIVKELQLEHCANNYCRWLSAGEKRRTTLGLELVVNPGLALLDEPTSGLDRYVLEHGTVDYCLV